MEFKEYRVAEVVRELKKARASRGGRGVAGQPGDVCCRPGPELFSLHKPPAASTSGSLYYTMTGSDGMQKMLPEAHSKRKHPLHPLCARTAFSCNKLVLFIYALLFLVS